MLLNNFEFGDYPPIANAYVKNSGTLDSSPNNYQGLCFGFLLEWHSDLQKTIGSSKKLNFFRKEEKNLTLVAKLSAKIPLYPFKELLQNYPALQP